MNPKDTYIFETIVHLANSITDKDMAVVAMLALAQRLACKVSEKNAETGKPLCEGCIFNGWSLCQEIYKFNKYNGVDNKYEPEENESEENSNEN